MNKDKKLVKNYILNLIYQIFTLITPLITTPYISRVLGVENIGIYSYTLSIVTYFIVAGSLGFPFYGQKVIATAGDDKEERSKLFFQITFAQLGLILITMCLYTSFIFAFVTEYRSIYLIQMVGLFGSAFATSWFYMGLEKFEVTVGKNIFVKLFSIIAIFIFVKDSTDLSIYTLIMGLSNVIGNIIILFDIHKYISFKYYKVKLKEVLRHLKPALILGIPYCITTIYAVIDKTMLGFLGNSYSEVGFYEQSQKIITLSLAVVSAVSTVMFPRLANVIAQNNKEESKRLLTTGTKGVILLSLPIMFILLIVSPIMVPWFFGPGYEKVSELIQIFSPLALIMGISNLLGNQYLVAINQEKKLTYILLGGVILNCVLNFFLIPLWGSNGAAIGTVISEFVKLIIIIKILWNDVNKKELIQPGVKCLVASLIMFIVMYLCRISFLIENTFVNTFIICILGILIYCFSLLILNIKFIKFYFNKYFKR